jgi:hypothetical protein
VCTVLSHDWLLTFSNKVLHSSSPALKTEAGSASEISVTGYSSSRRHFNFLSYIQTTHVLREGKERVCISILLFIALFYDAVTTADYAMSTQVLPFDYEPAPMG